MAVNLTIDGVVYSYPSADDPPPWGADATDWATAATTAIGLRVKDPMTANGDIIYRGAGVPAKLGIGSAGQVLTVSAGLPAWSGASAGLTTNPPKPSYQCVAGDTSQVQVLASATKPLYLVIGGAKYTVTSNLTMDLDTAGFGGLDTGVKAAATVYYLYGVLDTGTPGLVCSVANPDTGPTGFADWTYIGAFRTNTSASTVMSFNSCRGKLRGEIVQYVSHTGNTSETAKTLVAPVTALQLYIAILFTPGAGSSAYVSGVAGLSGTYPLIVYADVANSSGQNNGEINVTTPTTIYLKTDGAGQTVYAYLLGWNEDPQAWK